TPVKREPMTIEWDVESAEKGGYPHFVLKEIHEQPEAMRRALTGRVHDGQLHLAEMEQMKQAGLLDKVQRIVIVACGTSYHAVLYLQAGPEIGVVATKTFITSVTVLYMLGLYLARQRGRMASEEARMVLESLEHIPDQIQHILDRATSPDDVIEPLAKHLSHCSSMMFIGRGLSFPTALEGALKLKEISYM